MNDDELGRAVGTALAAPQLQAAPGAGAALRARAGRERGRRAVLGVAAAGVVVALAVGVVRWTPEASTTAASPSASPAGGLTLLATPFTVGPVGACLETAGTACTGPVAMTVDQVTSVRAAGPTLVLDLTIEDSATLASIAGGAGTPLELRVGPGRPARAELADGQVVARLADPAAAAAAVTELQPYRAGPPRTGPGPLTVPLELWSVRSAVAGPCTGTSAEPGTRVVDRGGECQVLSGPGIRIRSADLQVLKPDDTNTGWRVTVTLPPGDSALRTWSRTQVDRRIAFVAGRAVVAGAPLVVGVLSDTIEVLAEDRAEAEALVVRLRP